MYELPIATLARTLRHGEWFKQGRLKLLIANLGHGVGLARQGPNHDWDLCRPQMVGRVLGGRGGVERRGFHYASRYSTAECGDFIPLNVHP